MDVRRMAGKSLRVSARFEKNGGEAVVFAVRGGGRKKKKRRKMEGFWVGLRAQ